jgi:hypothetical protein
MDAVVEIVELGREIQGCDVRLGLIGSDTRNVGYRHGLEERRALAADRLAALETELGLQPEDTTAEEETAAEPA